MPDFDCAEPRVAATEFHYQVEPGSSGFTVTAPADRTPVRVELVEWAWSVTEAGRSGLPDVVALVRTRELVDVVARVLRRSWKRADGSYPVKPLADAAQRRTARSIYHRVAAETKRLLRAVPEEVLVTQRSVFAATFGNGLDMSPELYGPEFAMLRRDVRRYRAAAAALVLGSELAERAVQAELQASAEFTAATALAERAGLQIALNPGRQPPGGNPRACLERLARGWMGLFSPDSTPYTALTRTLMNVPGGVPPRTLARLAGIRLERPVTDRTVLLALLTAPCTLRAAMEILPPWAQGARGDDEQLTRILQHATREQICRAVQIAGAAMHRPLSARRVADIADAMSWACDYPGEHYGTVVGLARKSARWHQNMMQAEAATAIEQLGAGRTTRLPPVPLPDAEGVEFLATVAQVAGEGTQMHHCAASYAYAAVAGHCYLFHIQHRGEHATAEVSPHGAVRQLRGPGNHDNDACRYGRRVLTRWGRQLRHATAQLPPQLPALPPPWAQAPAQPVFPWRYPPVPL